MRKLVVEGCGVVHSADSDVQGPRAAWENKNEQA